MLLTSPAVLTINSVFAKDYFLCKANERSKECQEKTIAGAIFLDDVTHKKVYVAEIGINRIKKLN